MATDTTIEWTDKTWNPVAGCSLVSPGCTNCYAMRTAWRMHHSDKYKDLTRMTEHGPVWTGKIRLVPEALEEPLRWRKPCRVFVNSMSDLFHEDVAEEFLHSAFSVMALAKEHSFQILTKRPERMRYYFMRTDLPEQWVDAIPDGYPCASAYLEETRLPLPNVWLGVSVENQAAADERIPLLLQTPAAVRFLSVEPLLESVDIRGSDDWLFPTCCRYDLGKTENDQCNTPPCNGTRIDWVIVGGESGPNARSCNIEWIRSIVAQCKAAGVPCFVKQLGARPVWPHIVPGCSVREFNEPLDLHDHKGGDTAEWPEDLRVRDYPTP